MRPRQKPRISTTAAGPAASPARVTEPRRRGTAGCIRAASTTRWRVRGAATAENSPLSFLARPGGRNQAEATRLRRFASDRRHVVWLVTGGHD
jgi:hypothetical protein